MYNPPEYRHFDAFRANDLVVINIPQTVVEKERLDQAPWWHKLQQDPKMLTFTSCSRTLLLSSQEHLEEISARFPSFTARLKAQAQADKEKEIGNPDPFALPKPYFRKFEKWEAYEFLLRMMCGLESKNVGEEHINFQFCEAADKHEERFGKSWWNKILSAVKHDQREVRTHVLSEFSMPTPERSAIRLSKLKPGSIVMVVADTWEEAEPMLCELCKENSNIKPSSVILTSFRNDSSIQQSFGQQVKKAQQKNQITLDDVVVKSLDEVIEDGYVEFANTLFVVSQFGKTPAVEEKLIEEWSKKNPAIPFVVTDLKIVSEEEYMPHAQLKNMPNALVILPEDINRDFLPLHEKYEKMLNAGLNACQMATNIRCITQGKHNMNGKGFSASDVKAYLDQYTQPRNQRLH